MLDRRKLTEASLNRTNSSGAHEMKRSEGI
jgi:hypothetical protein